MMRRNIQISLSKKYLFILAVFFTFCWMDLKAQQDAMYTHYMFNTITVNPGYAGTRDVLTITGLHRSQWISFPGAPTTQTLTLHTPILNQNLGVGASFFNDVIGATKVQSFNVDAAYRLKIKETMNLSVGLKLGVNRRASNLTNLEIQEKNDVAFSENINVTKPNVGFGAYFYTPKYYVGFSVPRVVQNKFDLSAALGSSLGEIRHYYLIAGAVFNLNKTGSIKIKPTTFIKVASGVPAESDYTVKFLFRDKFWAGPMLRTNSNFDIVNGDGMGVIVGYQFSPDISAGYSFDWSLVNTTGAYNNGSHEIMLRYEFFRSNQSRIKSPRYF